MPRGKPQEREPNSECIVLKTQTPQGSEECRRVANTRPHSTIPHRVLDTSGKNIDNNNLNVGRDGGTLPVHAQVSETSTKSQPPSPAFPAGGCVGRGLYGSPGSGGGRDSFHPPSSHSPTFEASVLVAEQRKVKYASGSEASPHHDMKSSQSTHHCKVAEQSQFPSQRTPPRRPCVR